MSDNHAWRGEGPPPPCWSEPDGTIVFRDHGSYVFDDVRPVPNPPSTTPAEDRTRLPVIVTGASNGMGIWVIRDEGVPIEEGPDGKIRRVPPTPDLSDLKAALKGLRDDWPVFFRERRLAHTSLHRLFLAAERAGLLTDERPADPVEVAREALEDALRDMEWADLVLGEVGSHPRHQTMQKARSALAALRQGRGE